MGINAHSFEYVRAVPAIFIRKYDYWQIESIRFTGIYDMHTFPIVLPFENEKINRNKN